MVESCEDGWEIFVKGKRLDRVEQLVKCARVGDLVVRRVVKVVEERREEEAKEEQQDEA